MQITNLQPAWVVRVSGAGAVQHGFFLMARGWGDDPVFGGAREAFTRRDSWAWLMENARWQDGKVLLGGKLVELKRGQLCATIKFMANAWKWADSKVRRWLAVLSSVKKIFIGGDQKSTVLTICDYDQIQSPAANDRRTIGESSANHRRIIGDNLKERKEGKEGNKGKSRKDSDPPAVDRLQVVEAAAEPEQAISTPEPLQEATEPVQTVEGVADWEKPKTALAVVRSPMVRASAAPAATSATWNAYAEAYERRYGTPPIRNAMVNGQIASLLRRVPMEEAPAIADYYLSLSKRYYVESQHPVGALLKDCESVRTQWATGRTMTSTKAQQTDRRRAAFEATFDAIEIIERRHEGARV
jgi:hypothetical protein